MKTSCCRSIKIHTTDNPDIQLCQNPDCDNYLLPASIISTSKTWNQLFMVFFFIFSFMLTLDDYSISIYGENRSSKASSGLFNKAPLTFENLKLEIGKHQVLCPDQVFAQIMLESGYLTSFLSKKANNLTGMRYPFKRTTTAIGLFLPEKGLIVTGSQKDLLKYQHQNNYAVYSTWQSCITDYKQWQTECFNLNDHYTAFLGRYYAEDALYVEKIRLISGQ